MIRSALCITIMAAFAFLPTLHGNGYDDYPPDLAWSPVDNVLVAALEDRLIVWTPNKGQVTVI